MYKEDTFYVPDGVKIYMLFIIVKVYLIWLKGMNIVLQSQI